MLLHSSPKTRVVGHTRSFRCSICNNFAAPYHRMWVIGHLGHAFELCDIEGRQFDWFLNLLRVFLMCLCERYRLRYRKLFWLHHLEVYTGDLHTLTYRLLAPKSRVNLFLVYFSRARLVPIKTSHSVAPLFEAGIRYLNFGDIYKTEEFDSW